MVASNRIRCTVIAVEVLPDRCSSRSGVKDLLPWADPYVAQLIRNLQNEVRQERQKLSRVRHYEPALATSDVSTTRRISAAK
jgi:hypothetical protein